LSAAINVARDFLNPEAAIWAIGFWEELAMARITGLEKKRAPWHLRWFYGVMRKMFGKDLTPVKIQMRLSGMVWAGIAMEAGLGRKRLVSLRYIQLAKVRTAARIGCPF